MTTMRPKYRPASPGRAIIGARWPLASRNLPALTCMAQVSGPLVYLCFSRLIGGGGGSGGGGGLREIKLAIRSLALAREGEIIRWPVCAPGKARERARED